MRLEVEEYTYEFLIEPTYIIIRNISSQGTAVLNVLHEPSQTIADIFLCTCFRFNVITAVVNYVSPCGSSA